MKCATCDVKLNDELDVVYGLIEYNQSEEKVFCCSFCRKSWIADNRKV